jgi:hypothetical protein
MELQLRRVYFPGGTNGIISLNGIKVCNTIELPWVGNKKQVSCIPEGSYRLAQRQNQKFGWHLLLNNVPGRDWVLIHPANNAIEELQGCIAPVCLLTGQGKGLGSRAAMGRIRIVTARAFAAGEPILLNIKNHEDETS